MSTKVTLQPAFILHTRPYRNTSLLVEVFSRDYGRFTLVARGVKGAKSSRANLMQPFRALLMSWSGRGELKTLTGVEADNSFLNLRGSMLMSGYYLNELLMRLLHQHDPHEHLFLAYHSTLQALSNAQDERRIEEVVLRLFEKTLLDEIGYGLMLDCDVSDESPIRPDVTYQYILNEGPVSGMAADHIDGIRIRGAALISLARGEFVAPEDLVASKRLMRHVLRGLLGDKPLYSRQLYNKIVTS